MKDGDEVAQAETQKPPPVTTTEPVLPKDQENTVGKATDPSPKQASPPDAKQTGNATTPDPAPKTAKSERVKKIAVIERKGRVSPSLGGEPPPGDFVSADGHKVCSFVEEGGPLKVMLWDISQKKSMPLATEKYWRPCFGWFSEDGKSIQIAMTCIPSVNISHTHEIVSYDTANGAIIKSVKGTSKGRDYFSPVAFALSADKKLLAFHGGITSGLGRDVVILNISANSEVRRFPQQSGRRLAFGKDESVVAIGFSTAVLRRLEPQEKKPIEWQLESPIIGFSPDVSLIACPIPSKYTEVGVQVFDVQAKKKITTIEWADTAKRGTAINCAAFSHDGKYIAAACSLGTGGWKVGIWELSSGNALHSTTVAKIKVHSLEFTHDNGSLFLIGESSIIVLDISEGKSSLAIAVEKAAELMGK